MKTMRNSILVTLLSLVILTLASPSTQAFGQQKARRAPVGAKRSVSKKLTYDELIAKANEAIVAGQYVPAITLAQNAIKANPEDFQGHYYASYALFKQGLLDEAEPIARQAKTLATTAKQGDVDRLIEAIGKTRTGLEHLKLAERSATDGDSAKAAQYFEKAYEAMPSRDDVGMKAARVYLEQLKDPSASIRILKQVMLKVQNPETLKLVADQLQKAESAEKALAEKRAEEEKQRAEEKRRADEQQRRDDEEKRRREEQQREQERKERERNERESKISELESRKQRLESDLSEAEEKVSYEEERAEKDEALAEDFQQKADDAARNGNYGGVVAAVAASRYKESAKRHRSNARDLKSRIATMRRQIDGIRDDISGLRRY